MGKGDPPVESQGAEWTHFLNSFLERSLGDAGSKLHLRLDQRFLSKELYMHISLASVQQAIEATKAKSSLL